MILNDYYFEPVREHALMNELLELSALSVACYAARQQEYAEEA